MKFIENKISREDFFKISEDEVMFITNPGRMGDEDGSTFIIKEGNEFKIYRLDGWLYRSRDKRGEYISLEDASKQFPMWRDSWKNNGNSKYTYINMGFGNGLSVDNSIYEKYKFFLDKKSNDGDIFNSWKNAFIDMIDNQIK